MNKINLTANVSTTRVEGKAKFLTHVLIVNGNTHIAHAKLVGKWSSEQALAEFKKNPAKFTATPKFAGTLNTLAQAA